ncbi:MAG: AbrB/MazE/SpoVT family DNA-binding domain-containing protein [Ginsengibacter sp.]
METLKLKVRKIGNSKGIVIPQKYLSQVESDQEEILIEVDEKGILLKSNQQSPRMGWEKAFKRMAKNGDDTLLMPDVFDDETLENWK